MVQRTLFALGIVLTATIAQAAISITPPPVGAVCKPAALRTVAAVADNPMLASARVLQGAEAEAYVVAQRKRNPQTHAALEDSEKFFLDKRWKRVGVQVVTFGGDAIEAPANRWLDRLKNWAFPTLKAQSYYDGSAEVYITTWDDGNPYTWEGNVYGWDYETGASYSADSQEDTSNHEYEPPYTLWARGFGGGPLNREASVTQPHIVQTAAMNNNRTCGCNPGYWARCFIRSAFDEAWPACGGFAAGCRFATVAYFQCLGGGCISNFAYRYISSVRDTTRACDL